MSDDFTGLLPDWKIKEYVEKYDMISPFQESLSDNNVISYGLSSYGYDTRLAPEFKVFRNAKQVSWQTGREQNILDPKNFNPDFVEEVVADTVVVPPNGFVLGTTIEYFKLPQWVMSICMSKSTYARCGLYINVTPVEPGTQAQVTLEIANTTNVPVRIYANEGICQFIFLASSKCDRDYAARSGKYMRQMGVTLPRIKGS